MRSFVKIKPLRNSKITLSFTDIGKSCLSRKVWASQICLLMLFAKILAKFPNLQYFPIHIVLKMAHSSISKGPFELKGVQCSPMTPSGLNTVKVCTSAAVIVASDKPCIDIVFCILFKRILWPDDLVLHFTLQWLLHNTRCDWHCPLGEFLLIFRTLIN